MKEIEKNLEKGQHFLINEEVLKKEIQIAEISKKDKIIEIGSGEGILTKELVKKSQKVLSFEIDKQYENILKELEKSNPNLKIIYSDATKYSWKGFNKIISNIPYYLAEKIIIKAVIENIPFLVLIVGENFKNIIEKKLTKSGIITDVFYDTKFIEKIEKNSFSPAPRVNSWLIKLELKDKNNNSEFIKNIIKRKGKIKNSIVYSLIEKGYSKKQAKIMLKNFGIENNVLESSTNRISGKTILKIINKYRDLFINPKL